MKQIYLHGLGQNPDSWSKVIEQLENVEDSMCPDLSELVQGQDTTYVSKSLCCFFGYVR